MGSIVLIVPGSLETRTGGYGYDRQIVAGLRALGWTVEVRELDDSFPVPTTAARTQAAQVLEAIADGRTVVIDGLACGALPLEVEQHSTRLGIVALVHHPLAAEAGLDEATRAQLRSSEQQALREVRLTIVTSRATARTLETDYGVPRDRIVVVEPGTDRAPLAPGSQNPTVDLLCVAAVIPRKAHDILIQALARVPFPNWRLTCLGSMTRDAETAERLLRLLDETGLAGRVVLAGEAGADAVAGHYARADVFVLPTLYEGYGMAVAEAVARGLPVVSTPTGAIADLVGDAGMLVPPGDVDALAAALADVIGNASIRARLARLARARRARLPSWEDACRAMSDAIVRVGAIGTR